jgi:hypothetical protein
VRLPLLWGGGETLPGRSDINARGPSAQAMTKRRSHRPGLTTSCILSAVATRHVTPGTSSLCGRGPGTPVVPHTLSMVERYRFSSGSHSRATPAMQPSAYVGLHRARLTVSAPHSCCRAITWVHPSLCVRQSVTVHCTVHGPEGIVPNVAREDGVGGLF